MESRTCFTSVDVEHDFGEIKEFQGVENLGRILGIFKKQNVPATLFVTGEALEKYSHLIKNWAGDHEIACHSFTHRFWNTLGYEERKRELDDYASLYQEVFNEQPRGFRAPSHLIDSEGMKLLEEKGFLYDSSVVPHYPFFKKYRGFRGKAPLLPYFPSAGNYKARGEMKILEIPVRGQVFGIPLAGVWMARLPFWFYKILFSVYCPRFITINMHSWDIFGRPQFSGNLEKILGLLKKKNYQFLNGEQIFKNRQ